MSEKPWTIPATTRAFMGLSPEIHARAQQSKAGNGHVESFRLGRPFTQAVFPSHRLTKIVCSTACHDGNSQKADADNTERKQNPRRIAR